MTRTPLLRRALVTVLTASLAVTACGSGDEDAADTTGGFQPTTLPAAAPATDPATTAAPASTAAPAATDAPATEAPATEAPVQVEVPVVPDGTTLRIGDQQLTLERPLRASGEGEQVQADLEYATFAGGPPLIEAFNAGALDLGYVGDTPPVLAHARGQDIVIVGAWQFRGNNLAVVAPPGKDIASVADLNGKRFAYTSGTALQAFAIRALREAGLAEGDIEKVDVPILDVVGALKSGDVDAGVLVEPILTSYLTENPEARVVRDAEGLTSGLALLITTREVLEDPAKEAAIADYVYRQAVAFQFLADNPDVAAQAFADDNQIALEQAQLLIERNGTQTFRPIDDEIIGLLQELVDIFAEAGAIPEAYDAHELVDERFNPLVELAAA